MALLNLRPYQKPVVNPVKKEPTSALGKLFLGGGLLSSKKTTTPTAQNFTPKPVVPTFSGPMSKAPSIAPMPTFTSDSSKKPLPVAPKAPVAPAPVAPVENPNINILGQDISIPPAPTQTLRDKLAGAGLNLGKTNSVYDSLLQQSRALREQAAARQRALEAAYQPSAQEQDLQRQIAELTTNAEQGVAGLEGQGRGIPLGLVRGQQAKLEEQANIRLGGLGRALTAEQAIREGNIAAAQAGIEGISAEQEAAIQQAQIEQMAKTDARSQQVNQALALAPGANIIDKYNALLGEGIIDATDVPEAVQNVIFSSPEAYKPITLGYGETLVDPYTGQPIAMGQQKPVEEITPYQQAQLDIQRQQLAQGKQLSPDQVNRISEGNQMPLVLQGLQDTISQNSDLFGPVAGRAAGLNPYSTRAQSIQAELKRAMQSIGKYLEGGVLRAEDEAKYAKMLPQLSDTPAVAAAKLDGIKTLLEAKQAQYLRDVGSGGYNTSNFGAEGGDFSW